MLTNKLHYNKIAPCASCGIIKVFFNLNLNILSLWTQSDTAL